MTQNSTLTNSKLNAAVPDTGGPRFKFSEAISLQVNLGNAARNGLLLGEAVTRWGPEGAAVAMARRAMEAMLKMKKIEIDESQRASTVAR